MISEKTQQAAKQADSRAISALLNHSLNPKGIKVRVRKKDGRLKVLLEYDRPWTSESMVAYVKKFFVELEAHSIETIAVYGKRIRARPTSWAEAWLETIYLNGKYL